MRTSLNNIKKNEDYIHGTLREDEGLLFEARMIVSPMLREEIRLQKKIYSVITAFGRKLLRKEIQVVHEDIFHRESHPLKDRVHKLFN